MKKKFYESNWFTIIMLILFFPVGLYVMWKYVKWNNILKIGISVFWGIMVFSVLLSGVQIKTYSSEITYKTEAVAAKEAVYSNPYNKTFEYQTAGTVLICGEDIPNQEVKMDHEGSNPFGDSTIVKFQADGAGDFEGKSLAKGEKFTCQDGKQIRVSNDTGQITFTGEGELIEEATDAIPSQEITESYEITNEEGAQPVCKSNDEVVNCESLEKYNELTEDIESQISQDN